MDKALVFVNKETKERLYFLRIVSRRDSFTGMRKVVAVCIRQGTYEQFDFDPEELFGKKSQWEYKEGMVFEG